MMTTASRRFFGLSLLAAMTLNPLAHAAPESAVKATALTPTGESAALPHSREFTITSRAGKDYRIFVSVPPG